VLFFSASLRPLAAGGELWSTRLTTETTRLPAVGNLPVSASPAFSNDDLALIFGTCLPYPALVIDPEAGLLVAGNAKLCSLLGIEYMELEPPGIGWEKLIVPGDRGIFHTWERTLSGTNELEFEIRFQTILGARSAQVFLSAFLWHQRRYLIGFLREVSAAERQEEEWKRQFEEQKQRAFEAIKSSLRLYQFNEKIRRTPLLTRKLLHAANEEELFEQAAGVLTLEEGLGYKNASFLLLDGGSLRLAFSTQPAAESSYSLTDDNRFTRFIRRNFKSGGSSGSGILVPLESRGNLLGFCEVVPHSKEKVFFDEMGVVSEWQREVLSDIGGIIGLILDNLRLNREIKRQSIIDPLTQAYNRHYFVSRLTAEVERSIRYSRPVSVLFVDVDQFKLVNDQHGHLQGDEVLRSVGKLFKVCLRDVDVVCRYGGDEFIVLFPETDLEMARCAAEKLLRTVGSHKFPVIDDPEKTLQITLSMGLSSLKPGMRDDALLKAADEALYKAKSRGRNCLEVVE